MMETCYLLKKKKIFCPLPSSSDGKSVTEYLGPHNTCEPSKCPTLVNHFFSSTLLLTNFLSSIKQQLISRVRLSATPWTAAHQAPLSMGFSRQKYWSGLPFPTPGDLSKIKETPLMCSRGYTRLTCYRKPPLESLNLIPILYLCLADCLLRF